MSATRKPWLLLAALGFAVMLFVGDSRTAAEFELEEEEFDPNELVGALTLRITVGAGGEALAEPIALDLGLGFPLWLQPVGREEDETVPFGALPQASDANREVAAGSTAEFTFAVASAGDEDELRTGSQLLSALRMSEISRIGFLSRGEGKWVLASYEIEINGKPFAKNDDVNAAIETVQTAAIERLVELGSEIEPLRTEAEDLQLLVDTELATEEELARLEELEAEVQPLLQEQNRLERQLAGSYPWYLESDFDSPWRGEESVGQVRVSLVTASHAGAETQNYVYYQNGGHKYLLSSPTNPLRPEDGIRHFTLDLVGAPLAASDLRGHGLGMLAHGDPYGAAPDRWHCERLLVEVDGTVVYDSDENELDRMSLQSVRVIPPAHYDEQGELVTNVPAERETFLWIAGRGQGLDLVNGGAAALPDPDDEDFPPPEPGLPFHEEEYVDEGYFEGFEDGFPPFPGEGVFVPQVIIVEPWVPPVVIWQPPISWWDVWASPWANWLGFIDALIDLITGNPAGLPVQVENVRIVPGPGGIGWDVVWDVFGDTSQVVSYDVEIFVLQPHIGPLFPTIPAGSAPPGLHRVPLPAGIDAQAVGILGGGDPLLAYLWPEVTPMETTGPAPGTLGAARALTEVRGDVTLPIRAIGWDTDTGASGAFGIPGIGPGYWDPGAVLSHTGILFDAPIAGSNTYHVALKAPPPETWIEGDFLYDGFLPFNGNVSIVGHAGFADVNPVAKSVDVELWSRIDGPWQPDNWPDVRNDGFILTPIHVDRFPPPAGFGWNLQMDWMSRNTGPLGDPQQPTILFGLRAIRVGP